MGYWAQKKEERDHRRSLYNQMVERAMEIPNSRDGSTASRAILPTHTKTLCEEMGITTESNADNYCACVKRYLDGGYPGNNGLGRMWAEAIGPGKLHGFV